MDPIMRRAIGWRGDELLLLLFLAEARKGDATVVVVTNARVVGLVNAG